MRSIFVPEDETCFYVYEATRVENVREAALRAELPSAGLVPSADPEEEIT